MPAETNLDAWCKGYAAGSTGVPEDVNPYSGRAELAAAWQTGWSKSRSADHVALPFGGLRPSADVSRVLKRLADEA